MSQTALTLKHRIRIARRRARELAMIGSALASTEHPVMAHIIPMRRCNLSCAYCNEYDDFHVNLNSVVGGGIHNPQDALTVSTRAIELGFTSTVGIIHDGDGQLRPLSPEEISVYEQIMEFEKKNYSQFNHFQKNIAYGRPNDWRCRAGARYLYICENGLVHYCSQQRGYPGVPLSTYSIDDIRREYLTEKGCAPHCTVSCVHQISYIDHWRSPQHSADLGFTAPSDQTLNGT